MSRWKLAFVLWPILIVAGLFMAACDDGSDDGGGSSGSFSVALASKVQPATATTPTTKIVSGTAGAGEVQGLAVNSNSAKQAAGNTLDVWVIDEAYFTASTGVVKPKTSGGSDNYVVAWDAYAVGTAGTADADSVAGSAAADKVTIGKSASDGNTVTKLARMNITVGADLLNAASNPGAVVVVSVYEPGTATVDTGLGKADKRLARYELTITKAAALSLTGAKVGAKAGIGADNATLPTSYGQTITPVAVASGSVTLELATAVAAANKLVSFNDFAVTGGTLPDVTWKAVGDDGTGANLIATKVGNTAGTAGDTTTVVDLVKATHADFLSAADTDKGKVVLTGTDKYGQSVTINVLLDDGKDA